ncbi:MAG TPA: YjjG family noncanonical pyrimidine nucleotidase [Edaphocola sp.]|nr:YjjG family noncanonical pyrimidine nucleotidase [Edaphocola sp.]
MKNYKHLFFDLDHTLWDFEQNSRAVLKQLFEDFRLEPKGVSSLESFQDHFEQQNDKFWTRFRKGQVNREQLRWKRFWHTLISFDIRDHALAVDLSDAYLQQLPQQSALMPFAEELLKYCQNKDYRLHLITNGFEQTQWMKLKQSGIDGYFGKMITSQNCGALKPDARIFDFALRETDADVSTSLMIGDALEADVLGARAFGMDQVFYNVRKTKHAEMPTYEINSLEELLTIL